MDLTKAHEEAVQRIVSSGNLKHDPKHFLAFWDRNPMIYGPDSPQRLYLDMLLLALAFSKDGDAQAFKIKGVGGDKSISPFISNYYIDWNKQGHVVSGGFQRHADKGANIDLDREKERVAFAKGFQGSAFGSGPLSATDLKKPGVKDKLIQGIVKDNQRDQVTSSTIRKPYGAKPAQIKKLVSEAKDKKFHDATLVNVFGEQIRNFMVRRACKFLIHESVNHDRLLAYALDDLDIGSIARASHINIGTGGDQRWKVPVCTSEIREIFRNWDALEGKVVFFRDFVEVDPPWVGASAGKPEVVAAWSQYAAARCSKLLKQQPQHAMKTQLAAVVQQHGDKKHAQAIASFHATRPSQDNLKLAAWAVDTKPAIGGKAEVH